MYRTFDFPDPAVSSGDRSVTTVASQALFMMNSRLVEASSETLAVRLLDDQRLSVRDRINRACESILGRPAEPDEIDEWLDFLERFQRRAISSTKPPADRLPMAWARLCRALLSSNEFLYVE
jgi:hypothetical protein